MLLFRVGTERRSEVYPLTADEAMKLKRSIEGFLAAANIALPMTSRDQQDRSSK
jgi:hypothetical protein